MKKQNYNNFIKESRILDNGAIFLSVLILYSLWIEAESSVLNILFFTVLFMICSALSFRGKGK